MIIAEPVRRTGSSPPSHRRTGGNYLLVALRVLGLLVVFGVASVVAIAACVALPATQAGGGRNQCSNPVLASGARDWGSLDGTAVSRERVSGVPGASWAFSTKGHKFFMPPLDVLPGQSWQLSAQVRVVNGAGTARMTVEWYDSADEYVGEQLTPPVTLPAGGTWTTLGDTFTAPPGAVSAHVIPTGDFGAATGTDLQATLADYEIATHAPSASAAARYHWGTSVKSQSDEYNDGSVNLSKWGLFGANQGESVGCSSGYNGHGQRCASQTTEGGGYLTVKGTADGRTGGLYSRMPAFRYGRVEVRVRAVTVGGGAGGGQPYHVVALLWPADGTDYQQSEIDFAERTVGSQTMALFVHNNGTQKCTVKIDPTRFHTYAVDWEPDSISWYVDGALLCSLTAQVKSFSQSNGGAQMDMFYKTGTVMKPARLDVDYVRMYATADTTYRD
jgi:hypothetical protein